MHEVGDHGERKVEVLGKSTASKSQVSAVMACGSARAQLWEG